MKITEFALSRLRNEEHFQFHTSFRDLVAETKPSGLKIEAMFPGYQEAYANEMAALNIIRKSLVTDELEDSDEERDNVFRGMCNAVISALNHYDPNVREAAKRLQIVFDTYGNVTIKPYEAETGAINGLINELTTNYAADVAIVLLTGWLTELIAKNKAFDDLKNTRYSDETAKTNLRMKQERVKTDAIYRQIVERINALIVVEGDAAYAGFVKEMNERIDAFGKTIAIRKAAEKKAPEATAKIQA